MPTEFMPARFEFPRLEGRAAVAAFDGGRITTDVGGLLLVAAGHRGNVGLTRMTLQSRPRCYRQ